jgi:hypothetical protein
VIFFHIQQHIHRRRYTAELDEFQREIGHILCTIMQIEYKH